MGSGSRFDIVSVTIIDGAYLLDRDVVAPDSVVFRVRNLSESGSVHGFYFGRLTTEASEQDIRGSKPGVIARGLVDADIAADGVERSFRLTGLVAGRYVLLCLRPGVDGDTFCYQNGMLRVIAVEATSSGVADPARSQK